MSTFIKMHLHQCWPDVAPGNMSYLNPFGSCLVLWSQDGSLSWDAPVLRKSRSCGGSNSSQASICF